MCIAVDIFGDSEQQRAHTLFLCFARAIRTRVGARKQDEKPTQYSNMRGTKVAPAFKHHISLLVEHLTHRILGPEHNQWTKETSRLVLGETTATQGAKAAHARVRGAMKDIFYFRLLRLMDAFQSL